MRLKKLGAALVVVAVLGVVLASSALAAATTTDVTWYVGASPGELPLVGSETISAGLAGSATLETIDAGTRYELEIAGVNCVGCKIENTGATAGGSGKLEFTGVTIVKPTGCSVASTITTKELTLEPDWMSGNTDYIKITPKAGSSTQFATIQVTGCASATTIVPKGTVFGETANPTGTQAAEQRASLSEAINTAAGGAAGELHAGSEAVELTATLKLAMNGVKAGQPFGTH